MAMLAALQASIAAIQVQGTENAAAVAVLAARVDAAEAPNGWHTPVDTPARTFVLPLAGTPAPGSLATPVAGSPRLSGVAGARGTTAAPGGPITATFAQAVTTGTGSTSTSTATQDEKAMYNALPRLKDSTSSVLLGGAADVVNSPLASFHKQVMSFMKAFPNSGLGLRALVSPEAMSALGTETAFYEVTKNDVPATDADLMSGILALLMSRTGPTSEALLRSFKNVLGSSKFGAAPTRDASLAAMDALAGAAEALCTTQGSGEVHSQAVAIFLAESNNLVAPATRRLLTQLLCAGGPAATAAGGSATGKLDDLIMSWPDFVRAVKSHMNADRVLSSQLDAAYGARRLDGATVLTTRTHANRLVPYNMGRTSADDLHQNKLPSGYYVVAAILNGPRNDDGLFEVSWKHTQTTTWEPAVALRQVVLFRKYCDERGLDYDGKTKPTVDERGGDKTATSSVADSAGSGSRRSGRTRPNSQRR